MFDKKEESFEKSTTANKAVPTRLEGIIVRTIPAEFYDGKTGNGTGGLAAPEIIKPNTPPPVKPVVPVTPPVGAPTQPELSVHKVSPVIWIVVGLVIVVFLGLGGYAYYAFVIKKPVVIVPPAEVIAAPEVPVEEVIPEVPVEIATSTPVVVEVPKQYPVGLREYGTSVDTDHDGLTDLEEQTIYKTNPTQPDSDADGFVDGHEVENLYNPGGFKPVKLEEAGLVSVYANSVFGYRVLVPQTFAHGQTDTDGRDVVFTAQTGEFFAITVHPNTTKVPLLDWYKLHAPQLEGETPVPFVTKQGIKALRSPDSLVVYIARDSIVYELRYDLGLQVEANFLQTFIILQNSFAFTTSPQYVPQEIEIKPADAVVPEPVVAAEPIVSVPAPSVATSTEMVTPEP